MSQRLVIPLVAVLAFAIGLFAGIWAERHQPLPAPPAGFGGEFSGHHRPYGPHHEPPDRAALVREVKALRPELEAFRAKMIAIDDAFSRDFDAVLNAEQRAVHSDRLQRRTERRNHMAGAKDGDKLIFALTDMTERSMLFDIVVPLRLDFLTRIFKLDDAQREKTRSLLIARRQKVIDLIDSSPPPSVMLSRLAPYFKELAPPGHDQAPTPGPTR